MQMKFQFPTKQILQQIAQLKTDGKLREILNDEKQQYQARGINLKYEVTPWTNKTDGVQKIGAYCSQCDARIIYRKQNDEEMFKISQIIQYHVHKKYLKEVKPNNVSSFINQNSQNKQEDTSPVTKLVKNISKQLQQFSIRTQKQNNRIYKEFVAQWFHQYEKNIIRLMKKLTTMPSLYKKIQLDTIRENISHNNKIINHQQLKIIFQKRSMWSDSAHKFLENQNFKKIQFKGEIYYHPDLRFMNCLLIKNTYLSQNPTQKVIYILRRQITMKSIVQSKKTQATYQLQYLLAFQLDAQFQPKLIWFTIIQKHSYKKQSGHCKAEVLRLIEVFFEIKSIKQFNQSTFVVQNDPILIQSLQLVKKTFLKINNQTSFKICIHPQIVDRMIKNEKLDPQSQKRLINLIRCHKPQDFQTIKQDKSIIQQFLANARLYCLQYMNNDFQIGMNFFERQFYEINQLKIPFVELSNCLNFNGTMTSYEFILLILTIFENFKLIFQSNYKQRIKQVNHLFELNNYFLKGKEFQNQSFKDKCQSILTNPKYQFDLIILNCPRILIQAIYDLIPLSFQLMVQKMTLQQLKNKRIVPLKYKTTNIIEARVNFNSQHLEHSNSQKIWSCNCKFYEKYGFPCQHQILCALNFQTSLYREINIKWKSQEINTKNCQRFITARINKIF